MEKSTQRITLQLKTVDLTGQIDTCLSVFLGGGDFLGMSCLNREANNYTAESYFPAPNKSNPKSTHDQLKLLPIEEYFL